MSPAAKIGIRPDAAQATTPARRSSGYVQSVPAVEQATRILRALAEDGSGTMTLAEVTRAVDINKSKVLAILNTLCTAGSSPATSATRPTAWGSACCRSAAPCWTRPTPRGPPAPILDALSLATDATAWLGLVDGDEIIVVDRREHPSGMGIAARVGHRFPLTWGAHGKALLAILPCRRARADAARRAPVGAGRRAAGRPWTSTLCGPNSTECRRLGYATDLGETRTGVNAIGAVV